MHDDKLCRGRIGGGLAQRASVAQASARTCGAECCARTRGYAWKRVQDERGRPPIVPTGADVYNRAYGWLGRQFHASLPDRHAGDGRSAIFADAHLRVRAQRRRRARHRRQQADRDDAVLAVRADRRAAHRRRAAPHAGPFRRSGAGRSRLRAPPAARQLAVHARRRRRRRAHHVEGRTGGGRSRRRAEGRDRLAGICRLVGRAARGGDRAECVAHGCRRSATCCSKRPPKGGFRPRCASSASTSRGCPAMSGTHDSWVDRTRRARRRCSRSTSERAGSASR